MQTLMCTRAEPGLKANWIGGDPRVISQVSGEWSQTPLIPPEKTSSTQNEDSFALL